MNRRHRLRGRARIAAVRARGAGGRSSAVRVHALANGGLAGRAAFAVGGRIGAVQRNRARRRLRVAAAQVLQAYPGFDILVSVRPGSVEPPFTELTDWLEQAVGHAVSRVQR